MRSVSTILALAETKFTFVASDKPNIVNVSKSGNMNSIFKLLSGPPALVFPFKNQTSVLCFV